MSVVTSFARAIVRAGAGSARRVRDALPAALPLKIHLAIFAALLLVPALLLSAFLLYDAAHERRREVERRIVQLATDLADDISNELEGAVTILRTLSYSSSLESGNLKAFHTQAKGIAATRDAEIILLASNGQQLINTALPFGAPLAPYSNEEALKATRSANTPYVTDLFFGRLRQIYVVNVLYPIVDGEIVRYVLAMSLTTDRLHRLLLSQSLGPEWLNAVVDRKGAVIATLRANEGFEARSLEAPISSSGGVKVGAPEVVRGNGRGLVRAAAVTRIGGWTVTVAVGEGYVSAVALQSIAGLLIGSAALLGVAALLVVLYGRQLAAAIDGVTQAMRGNPAPQANVISEAARAARTLATASEALRRSEARFRSIYQNAATGIALTDLDGRMEAANPAFSRLTGLTAAELLGRMIENRVHPDDRAEYRQHMQHLLQEKVPSFEAELRFVMRDGRHIWVQQHAALMRSEDGHATGVVVLVTDMSERREHEEALAIALERSKIAQQAAHAALYEHAPATGELIYDATITTVTGYSAAEISDLEHGHRALIHPADRAGATSAIEHGLASEKGFDINYRLRQKSGRFVWVHDRARLLKASTRSKERVIGMVLDITDQKAREEHINLLLREVNHRSKNMLGLVQAIARQTAATDAEEFVAKFSERIQALSANQDLLVRNEWGGVDLKELVETQLAHFASVREERISAAGPSVQLSPASAQVLGMVLHELATNASKYGALSNDSGHVDIRWSIADGETFTISWQERGGPMVSPGTAQKGFGSTVIGPMARMGLEAEVETAYLPLGLRWELTCPLQKIMDRAAHRPARQQTPLAAPSGAETARPCILVVEDEALIAMELSDMLLKDGFNVLGPVRSVAQALSLLGAERCDAAVLDVNLGDETAEPVGVALAAKQIPFVTVSGYDPSQQPAALRSAPFIAKPVDRERLVRALQSCLRDRDGKVRAAS